MRYKLRFKRNKVCGTGNIKVVFAWVYKSHGLWVSVIYSTDLWDMIHMSKFTMSPNRIVYVEYNQKLLKKDSLSGQCLVSEFKKP